MASKAEGEYDFVEKPSEEFFCPVSFELLLDPVLTNFCCGNHLSREVAKILADWGKPCPLCKKGPLKTTEDLFFQRKVMALRVYCRMKSAGCKWKGELRDLDKHLKLGLVEGECGYVDVACPLECGEHLKRCSLKEHKSSKCPKRQFSCQYCSYESTYVKVVNDHWPKCQRFPKVCPNKCAPDEIERRFIQHHLQEECPLEIIACKFAFAGCKEKIQRESMEEHLEESENEHFEMTAMKCKALEMELIELKIVITKIHPKPIFSPPPDIVLDNFERRKNKGNRFFSPGFYTHIGGYKMCLCIDANESGSGKGTHVSVYVFMMKGEFDSHLKWPFKGEVTVELVNQRKGGVKYLMKPVEHNTPDKLFHRVTEDNRASYGLGIAKFISHSDLYKPEEDKEYLLNDTLSFRVANVEVTSI